MGKIDSLRDIEDATKQLQHIVAEIRDRVHLQDAPLLAPPTSDLDSQLTSLPKSDALEGIIAKRQYMDGSHNEMIGRLAALARELRSSSHIELALELKWRAAEALSIIKQKSKSSGNLADEGTRAEDSEDASGLLGAFRDDAISLVERAADVNGGLARSADFLISSLAQLEPSREGSTRDYAKSYVPDPFVEELSAAMEAAARDLTFLLLQHFSIFWTRQYFPKIEATMQVANASATEFQVDAVSKRFPQERLNELLKKACDDFCLRMRKGGVAAVIVSVPPPISALDVFKSAIRSPMQFVALATFIVLPAAAMVGLAAGVKSAGPWIKSFIVFILPALLTYSVIQARRAREAAFALSLENARRQLSSEVAKTSRELGSAISRVFEEFLDHEGERVQSRILAKADSELKNRRLREEAQADLERAATVGRAKALGDLRKALLASFGAAWKQIDKSVDEVHKSLASAEKNAQRGAKRNERAEKSAKRSAMRIKRKGAPELPPNDNIGNASTDSAG